MSTTNDPKRPPAKAGSGPPVYAIIGLLIALLLLGTGGFLWLNGEAGGPVVGGPFTLENADGQTVTDRDFRGKYMLVYFGYTYCPDVCPTTLNAVADALDKLGNKADRLQPLFVTVDPRRDTPAVMKQYTAAFTPRLEGLTGTPAEIAAAAK
jgi:protein SCO1/2